MVLTGCPGAPSIVGVRGERALAERPPTCSPTGQPPSLTSCPHDSTKRMSCRIGDFLYTEETMEEKHTDSWRLWTCALSALLALATAGCSEDETCKPGSTQSCGCTTATGTGNQVCNEDGSAWGPCLPCDDGSNEDVAGCQSDCSGKECGSDGCVGSCGTCSAGENCQYGTCVPGPCQPDCSGKECGSDGCTGSCGSCGRGQACEGGSCVDATCVPDFTPECGPDECGYVHKQCWVYRNADGTVSCSSTWVSDELDESRVPCSCVDGKCVDTPSNCHISDVVDLYSEFNSATVKPAGSVSAETCDTSNYCCEPGVLVLEGGSVTVTLQVTPSSDFLKFDVEARDDYAACLSAINSCPTIQSEVYLGTFEVQGQSECKWREGFPFVPTDSSIFDGGSVKLVTSDHRIGKIRVYSCVYQ